MAVAFRPSKMPLRPVDPAGSPIRKERPMDQQTALEFVQARISELHRQAAHERLVADARRLTMRAEGHEPETRSRSYGRPSSGTAPMNPAVRGSR
jgi:hypothetical protein